MTTTEPTTTLQAWLESVCPSEVRAEVDELIATIGQYTEELAPHLSRARDLLARFELATRQAGQSFPGAYQAITDLLDLATGSRALYDAVADLGDACDPCSHPVYAAVAAPGQLRVGDAIVVVGHDGGEHAVFVSGTNIEAEGKSFEVFDVNDPSGARWEISHDELIDGAQRGLRAAASDEAEG
jgi:hypothetical protein